MTGFPPGFTPEMWQAQTQQQQTMLTNYQQGMMNFPMATPFLQNYQYGIPPQAFPYMQNPWNQYMPPNMFSQPPLPGEPFPPVPATTDATAATNPQPPATANQFGVSPKPPAATQSPLVTQSPGPSLTSGVSGITDTPTPPKSLPPLPPCPKTPPPPGTEEEPVVIPKTQKIDATKALFKEDIKEVETKNILDDIPLPSMPPTPKKKEDKKTQDFKLSEDDSSSQIVTTDSESIDTQTTVRTADDNIVSGSEMSQAYGK